MAGEHMKEWSEWAIWKMHESCHMWTHHVTYIYRPTLCLTPKIDPHGRCSHEWVKSHMKESYHISMSHVTHEWVMSHINDPCHIWMSHGTYQCVMSHMNESCHVPIRHVTYECIMSHIHTDLHFGWQLKQIHTAGAHGHAVERNQCADWPLLRAPPVYQWVMSHMNESCHVCTSRVAWHDSITYLYSVLTGH